MQKNSVAKCRVLFPELAFPFLSNLIALVLSCINNTVGPQPCAFRNNLVHINGPITSLAATNSEVVELVVFSFCFLEAEIGDPSPQVMLKPE